MKEASSGIPTRDLPLIGERPGLNWGPADLRSAALPLSYVPN